MSTYSAGLLNVGTLNATGTSSTLTANTVTVTTLNTTNVNATNFSFNNNLNVAGNVKVTGTISSATNSVFVCCPYNPNTKWNAGAAGGQSLFAFAPGSNRGQGTFIGGISGLYDCETFLTIRYGNAPVGPLRLMPCVPYYLNPLGSIMGTGYPSTAPYARDFAYNPIKSDCIIDNGFVSASDFLVPKGNTQAPGVYNAFSQRLIDTDVLPTYTLAVDEDSLMLDLHRPIGTKITDNLPVIVWFHGGGLAFDSRTGYNAYAQMVKENKCIFVNVEYRLALLGWSADEQFRCPAVPHATNGFQIAGGQFAGVCGNMGLTDAIVALQWIQTNIGFFGGNPSNVSIWGESAGGLLVDYLRTSPLVLDSSGNCTLFKKAIINSGAYVSQASGSAFNYYTNTQGSSTGKRLSPTEWGQIIPTYFGNGNIPIQNKMTNQQILYCSMGFGKPTQYAGYFYYSDVSGNVVTDTTVDSSGFKTYVHAMSPSKAKYLALNNTDFVNGSAFGFQKETMLVPVWNAIGQSYPSPSIGLTGLTGGLSVNNGVTNIIPSYDATYDKKAVVYRTIPNALGQVPEGDSSGNKIGDVPVFYMSNTSEAELYDVPITGSISTSTTSATFFPASGGLLPCWYIDSSGQVPYPGNMCALQFNKGTVYRQKFATLASQFYKVPGQTRKNQGPYTWPDQVLNAINETPSGTITENLDIFDTWYAPQLLPTIDASGSITGATFRWPLHVGLGYTQTDASNNLPLIFDSSYNGATGYAVLSSYAYENDASGNSTIPVDASGNNITKSFYVSSFVITNSGKGFTSNSTVKVAAPTGALPIYINTTFPFFTGACLQTIGVKMESDLWSFANFDCAIRSADGPRKAYSASIGHYFKGVGGSVSATYETGAIHGLDLCMFTKAFEYSPGTAAAAFFRGLAVYPGKNGSRAIFNTANFNPYVYIPTNADYSVTQAMRDAVFNFALTDVPSFKENGVLTQVPSMSDSSGLGWYWNSDASGNDISTSTPIGSFNGGFMDFFYNLIYGTNVATQAANSAAASPSYYAFPLSNI